MKTLLLILLFLTEPCFGAATAVGPLTNISTLKTVGSGYHALWFAKTNTWTVYNPGTYSKGAWTGWTVYASGLTFSQLQQAAGVKPGT